MKLIFKTKHDSISGLICTEELPRLSIITGLNGSGKTHLLGALANGSVIIDGINKNQIKYFDYASFFKSDEQKVNSSNVYSAANSLFSRYTQSGGNRDYLKRTFQQRIELISTEVIGSLLIVDALAKFNRSPLKLESIDEVSNIQLEQVKQKYKDFLSENPGYAAVDRVAQRANKSVLLLTLQDFTEHHIVSFEDGSLLQARWSSAFLDYRLKQIRNASRFGLNQKINASLPHFSDEEFIHKYGKPPWEKMNERLAKLNNFPYRVNNPLDIYEERQTNQFIVNLIKNDSSGLKLQFSKLSSGEKILLSLAASDFTGEVSGAFPKLLLLDEIDGSLHPSQTETMFDFMNSVFCGEFQANVVLATHNPSTVALAPKKSVFVLESHEHKLLRKINKQAALDILTEGFISITNTASNRHLDFYISNSQAPILFVEGPTDKKILETAWIKLKHSELMPFTIQDAFDCYFLKNIFRRGDIFNNYPNQLFIGLFDFDTAVDCWKELRDKGKSNIEIEGTTIKWKNRRGYCLLLPVPEFRSEYANLDYPISYLSIELLFADQYVSEYCKKEAAAGGVELFKFRDKNKTKFATQIVPNLEKEAFSEFSKLFEIICEIVSEHESK